MKSTFIALFLGVCTVAHSQTRLSGTVTDDQNTILSGVSVYLPDFQKGTLTNADGIYWFANLPSGKIKVVFSYLGYSSQTQIIAATESETVLNVVLAQNVHQMDEVIVSTSFNRLQSQNVMKVEHASVKSLQQKGISTLVEGLATIPGVSNISTGTSVGKPVIRGLTGTRVLVYTQGVRLENQQFGEEHGLGLNDAGVESVEVIKGPASLLYGSDALGGVLYFNPEKFAETNTLRADFSERLFSNTLGSNTSIGVKTSSEAFRFLARGSFATHLDYQIPNGDRVTNTRFNESDFKTGLGYSGSRFSSTLRYNYNRIDLGIPEEGIAEQTHSRKTEFPKQLVENHIVSLHNNIFFSDSKLDVNLGYIFNDRSEFEDSNDPALQMKLSTLNYDMKYHFAKKGRIETIMGIQGMHQQNRNFGEEQLIPDANVTDFGAFGTANFDFTKTTILAGLRYDHRFITSEENGEAGEEAYFAPVTRSFNSLNASLGVKTNFSEKITVRLNVASGFRAPNLAELTSNGVHEGSNRYEIGNNDLKTEQNVQTDLNLEYKTDHFEFFVNGFYNHINNYIYISPAGNEIDGNPVYDYVQNNAALYGGEAGIHLHPHPLDWLHIESSFQNVAAKRSDGQYLPLIPANAWSNTLRSEFNIGKFLTEGFARVNVVTTFAQTNISEFETETPAYSLVNLGLGGKVRFGKTAFDISLNVNNAFNQTYIAHLSRLKPDGIPNMGRNVVFGLSFNI